MSRTTRSVTMLLVTCAAIVVARRFGLPVTNDARGAQPVEASGQGSREFFADRNTVGVVHRDRSVRAPVAPDTSDEALIDRAKKFLPGPGPRLMRVFRSDWFVVVSECDETWTRERLWLFDRTYNQFKIFAKQLGVELVAPTEPLVCVLIADDTRYTAFTRSSGDEIASWAAGYYATRWNWVVMYDERESRDAKEALRIIDQHESSTKQKIAQARGAGRLDEAKARKAILDIAKERTRIMALAQDNAVRKAIHECVHLISFNTGLQPKDRTPPVWLSEGLATSFETTNPRSAFGPGILSQPITPKRISLPLGKAVTLTDPKVIPTADVEGFYMMSADLFTQLFRTRRAQLRAYFLGIGSQGAGTPSEVVLTDLFETHFGSVEALGRQLGW